MALPCRLRKWDSTINCGILFKAEVRQKQTLLGTIFLLLECKFYKKKRVLFFFYLFLKHLPTNENRTCNTINNLTTKLKMSINGWIISELALLYGEILPKTIYISLFCDSSIQIMVLLFPYKCRNMYQRLLLIKYYHYEINYAVNITIQDFLVLGLFSFEEIRHCTVIFKTLKLERVIWSMPDILHEILLQIHAWFSEWRMPFSPASPWFVNHGKITKIALERNTKEFYLYHKFDRDI